jgi:hypothetical protein
VAVKTYTFDTEWLAFLLERYQRIIGLLPKLSAKNISNFKVTEI